MDFGTDHATQAFLVVVKDAGSSTYDKKGRSFFVHKHIQEMDKIWKHYKIEEQN
jgi:hypothetical protein